MTDSEKKNNPRKNREVALGAGAGAAQGAGAGGAGAAQGAGAGGAGAQSASFQTPNVSRETFDADVGVDGSQVAGATGTAAQAESTTAAGDAASSTAADKAASTTATGKASEPSKTPSKGKRKSIAKSVAAQASKNEKTSKDRPAATHSIKRVLRIIIGVVVATFAAAALWFCFAHWWAHDDATDIQGTWLIDGSQATITITESEIVLSNDVSYEYEIDPLTKTISFSFGTYSGQGYYRFSLDHSQLCIVDGERNWFDSIFGDISWTFSATFEQLSGTQLPPTFSTENETNLAKS